MSQQEQRGSDSPNDSTGQRGTPQSNQQGQNGAYQNNQEVDEENGNDYDEATGRDQGDDNFADGNQQQGADADSYGDSFAGGDAENTESPENDRNYNDPEENDMNGEEDQFVDETVVDDGSPQQPYAAYDPRAAPGLEALEEPGLGDGQDDYRPGYDAGAEPGLDAGQDGYGPGYGAGAAPGYDDGQDGYGAEEDAYRQDQPYGQYGQSQGYNQYGQAGQDQQPGQAQSFNQYGQSGQPNQSGQVDPYGRQQPDPYASRVPQTVSTKYAAAPEQARSAPQQTNGDGGLRSSIVMALLCVACILVVVVVLVVVLLVLYLEDEDEPVTANQVPATPPGVSTTVPTASPSSVTSPSPGWESSSANTFSASRSGAGFGSAIAVAGSFLVAGLPDKQGQPGFGSIVTYSREGGIRAFTPEGDKKEELAELFGSALDMSFNTETEILTLAVGAPRTAGIGTRTSITSFGSVFVYRMDENQEWLQVGNTIRSSETLQEAGGEFGGSVALAVDVDRVAVAAPSRSTNHSHYNTGGVAVFQLQDKNWTAMMSTPLVGPPESYYGDVIDLSNDGNGLIVGAPGRGNFTGGQVDFYKWDGSSKWENAYTASGTGTEMMGSTVAIINAEGTQIAYGIPGYNDERGAIRVFEDDGSEFTQMGKDIAGEEVGEKVGMVLCAKNSRVAVGTQTGVLRVYDFSDGEWVPLPNSPEVDEAILTCAMSDNGEAIVVGLASEKVKVYDLRK